MLTLPIPVVIDQIRTKAGRIYVDLTLAGGELNLEISNEHALQLKVGASFVCLFQVKALNIVQYARSKTVFEAVKLLEVKAGQGDD